MNSNLKLDLFRLGSSLYLFGCGWGCFIESAPYRRLALTAHIQAAATGTMAIVAGTLVESMKDIGPLKSSVVYWGIWVVWPMVLSECAAAYWGAKKVLPIAAEAAKAPGSTPWKEAIVGVTHYVSAIGNACAWVVLFNGLM
ncbi:hypothetical protein F5884DRAFT_900176 [Xylogone sp. PMI_703]|nr:hypothetical protein F5884DRAFT_900176 [Xylogone sp. PMI_703]